MLPDTYVIVIGFVTASTFVVMLYLLFGPRKDRVDDRIGALWEEPGAAGPAGFPGNRAPGAALPPGRGSPAGLLTPNPVTQWTSQRVKQKEKRDRLKDSMMQAGFYGPVAVNVFRIMRIVFLVAPAGLGLAAAQMGLVTPMVGLFAGAVAGLAGTIAPSFFLDHLKRGRQKQIRRALPDALDVMVVCLEGGLSLQAAFSRVSRELVTAHPMLAVEFNIIERQMQMGRGTGEAIRELAARFDLEELRTMASVIAQAERIGSSVTKALTVFADTLRMKRHQRAEEMAQKASVKLIFPTLLCIFPGIFVVLLGPAAIQIYQQIIQGIVRDIVQ